MLIEITAFYGSIYKKNSENANSDYYNVCEKYSRITELVTKITFLAYILMTVFYTSSIVIEYLIFDDITPPIGMFLPGTRDHTSIKFGLLVAANFLVLYFSIFVVVSYDSILFVVFANMPMVATIITLELNDLRNSLLHGNETTKQTNFRFKAIIFMHKSYSE